MAYSPCLPEQFKAIRKLESVVGDGDHFAGRPSARTLLVFKLNRL
jgi:hypothetical protein